jgi:hypothetical protein
MQPERHNFIWVSAVMATVGFGVTGSAVGQLAANRTASEVACNRAIAVAGGAVHTLALRSDGSVMGWGRDLNGETHAPTPNIGFVSISAGFSHSLGLRSEGTIAGWGGNPNGQLVIPLPNQGYVAVSAGESHSLGLRSDGSIEAWGCGSMNLGQCADPQLNSDFVAIGAGGYYSVGLKANGTVDVWGCQGLTPPTACDVPENATDLVSISAGWGHVVGLKVDGTIIAWPTGITNVPPAGTDFVAVAAGVNHSLGLKADGSIVAWGTNDFGESTVPEPNADFVAIAAGLIHSLGVKSDGRIIAWGWNDYGQTDVPQANEVNCNDGITCTIDSCDQATGVCMHALNHLICQDPFFCNGIEQCDPLNDCGPGSLTDCSDGISCTIDSCIEADDSCMHTPSDDSCSDRRFCNGTETCNPAVGCLPGVPPNCEDDVSCTIDICNEVYDTCTNIVLHDQCDDHVFCNGIETCDANVGCVGGALPCGSDQSCREESDECVESGVPTLNAWGFISMALVILILAKHRLRPVSLTH